MTPGSAIRAFAGTIGTGIVSFLMWLFGRRCQVSDVPWLAGPIGGPHIGDLSYEETAIREGLQIERNAAEGGLISNFQGLASPTFDPDQVDPRIRAFYADTAGFTFDAWSTAYFPARIVLWLLVQTISRRVDQLNFPLDGLEAARGMTSEIVLLRDENGAIKYTGWFRRLRSTGRAVYTGFYMTERVPRHDGLCEKVVFPMPGGNATVILRPENAAAGGFRLDSSATRFGDVGFYRIGQMRGGALRVWRVPSLHEQFHLYVEEDILRCDHHVRFLGLPVLSLHYRITGGGISGESSRDSVSP
jgi:hypothetical protein